MILSWCEISDHDNNYHVGGALTLYKDNVVASGQFCKARDNLFLLPIHDFRENGSTCITLHQSVSPSHISG